MSHTVVDQHGDMMVYVAHCLLQGLIRYYRPELEQRMKEYHDKKSAAKSVAAGKSIAAGQG